MSARGISTGEDINDSDVVTGDNNRVRRDGHFTGGDDRDERRPTQNVYSVTSDGLLFALNEISTDLRLLSRDFSTLKDQVSLLIRMSGDIERLGQLVTKLAETVEAEDVESLRAEFSELRGGSAFHFSAIWIAVAVLMVGLALLWMKVG